MIQIENFTFEDVNDPIRTEQTIYEQIKNKDLGLEYVGVPLAHSINTFGLEKTQRMIDGINYRHPHKKIYVCQHIFVKSLNFGENIIFTPHTLESDDYHFIPHFNPIYSNPPGRLKFNEKKFRFSFIGDFNTNSIREKLSVLNSELTPIHPTGKWFFLHGEAQRKNLLDVYLETLKNSKFSLCPMGTGPSTLRLFESMSVGSIPIIFNDIKIPPEIKKIIRSINIDEFIKNPDYIEKDDFLEEKDSEEIYDIYWENFSNENLYKSIIRTLKNNGY